MLIFKESRRGETEVEEERETEQQCEVHTNWLPPALIPTRTGDGFCN